MKKDNGTQKPAKSSRPNNAGSNKDQQAVDKTPGEERGNTEQVTLADQKAKKVDADLSKKNERT